MSKHSDAKTCNNLKIRTGISRLDDLLRGGFDPSIIHFFGAAGTGKSNLAMQITINAIKDYDANPIWMDLNANFDFKRLLSLADYDKGIVQKFRLIQPLDYDYFKQTINNMDTIITHATKVIVIDPITYYYRLNVSSKIWFKLQHELSELILARLIGYVMRNKLIVILINQMTNKGDELIAVCQDIIERHSIYSILFERIDRRKLFLRKLKNVKLNHPIDFQILDKYLM